MDSPSFTDRSDFELRVYGVAHGYSPVCLASSADECRRRVSSIYRSFHHAASPPRVSRLQWPGVLRSVCVDFWALELWS